MAAPTSSAREERIRKDDTPSGFLKLPAEIRNEIYRLVLLTRTTTHYSASWVPGSASPTRIEYTNFCVVIEDLEPEQLQALKEAGRATTRTTYKPRKLLDIEESDMCNNNDYATFKSMMEKRETAQYSYTLSRSPNQIPPIMSMLALNQQTRAEAAAIFYGENEFHFNGISPLFAFLMDRNDLSLQAMRLATQFEPPFEPPRHISKTLSLALSGESLDARLVNFKCHIIHIADSRYHPGWKRKRNAMLQKWERMVTKEFAHWACLRRVIAVFDF